MDPASGGWTHLQLVPLVNPSFLAVDRDRRFLYSVHADLDEVSAYAIDKASGQPTPLNQVPGAVVSLMDRTNVETVIVAGKVRKWKGQLDVELPHLRQQLEASRDYLFSAANIPQNLFSSQ
jgi:hypothetical protein